ncbi:helix-turn-helix domain-containing protein [Lactobacillus sp. PV034]|uniref:helix-turn-helix domain-containing protein n=1 Tax=Lactobacillus sp. PV034 TaxID=2594495 RepID=UPI00223FCAA8|nr:Rgg/GadR/MutR family transcriptional regulator [Lactobacillus sp. PV034]QNQ81106.1 helix-turn-helix domain-containing protein [Lactobacillus sp. PV034]
MTIGELLKEYRIRQDKKQKEFIGNIISPSYYSKVEKDLHRITVEDLTALLHYNNIPLWDFFSRLDSSDEFNHQQIKNLNDMMLDAYYSGDKERFSEISNLIDESNLSPKDKEEQKLLVAGWVESMKNEEDPADEELRNKLKEKIFSIPNFNEDKIVLFCNFMAFYDFESNKTITRQIMLQYQNTQNRKIQEDILAIIGNMLALITINKKYDQAVFYIEAANKIKTRPETFFYKNIIFFHENFINYHLTNNILYLQNCEKAVEVINTLGMLNYAHKLKKFYLTYK